jgi:hypothetical protein
MRFETTQQAETKHCLYNQTTHIASFNCLEAIHYFIPACDTADSYFDLRKSRFRLVEYCLPGGAGNKPGLERQWFLSTALFDAASNKLVDPRRKD